MEYWIETAEENHKHNEILRVYRKKPTYKIWPECKIFKVTSMKEINLDEENLVDRPEVCSEEIPYGLVDLFLARNGLEK